MYLLADQGSNAKLSKNASITSQWQTSIMYLSPSDSSGLTDSSGQPVNLCPAASPGCRASCLNTAGRGAMSSVQLGRLRKTRLYVESRQTFMHQLVADLETLANRQRRTGIRQAVRLNGTSDIDWENHPVVRGSQWFAGVPQAFPELQFYDYTKLPKRAALAGEDGWPTNYHLTFSRSEVNDPLVHRLLSRPWNLLNVAVVFIGDKLPETYCGKQVIDGTLHDMRFLDPVDCIVGLLAKGKAKRDESGFAINIGGAA